MLPSTYRYRFAVIAVRESKNVMKNDLASLPWRVGQFHRVENYWEAAGVIAAMRAGITPESVRRPLPYTRISTESLTERPCVRAEPQREGA